MQEDSSNTTYKSILVVPPSLPQLCELGQCRILTQGIGIGRILGVLLELSSLHLPPHLLSTAATAPNTFESLHIRHSRLGHASL